MKKVDSQALGVVNRALGLTGAGAPATELMDGTVDQVLEVGQLVRRGRTIAGSGGIFTGILSNTHAGADTQVTSYQPYGGSAGQLSPYPEPIPPSFDFWLLSASVDQLSGSGTLSAALFLDPAASSQGFGVDQAGAAISSHARMALAFWDSVVTETEEFALQESGAPWARIGMRILRSHVGNTVISFSTTSSAAAVFQCQLVVGLFPEGLGQDVLI